MRVLICGAGVAGPTLAWFLAKAGTHVTIIEKSSTPPHGQNVDLKGGAVTLIKKMGLMDQIRRFNTTEKGTKFVNSKGQTFASFPVDVGTSFSSEFEILRGDLVAILHEATKHHPNVNYLFGTTIEEVLSNDDDTVKVELSNGEVQEFDLLVAADGQWSKLRKQCFPPEDVKVVDLGMYVSYCTIPRLPSDNDWWNLYMALNSRIVSTRPDPHGTIKTMLSHMPCNDAEETAWRKAFQGDGQALKKFLKKEFADAGWQAQRILDAMDEASDFYFHVIQQIKMSRWSNSRIVCLGDAAYAPSPLSGMGTSLAIVGAHILAGELSKLDDGDNPSKALVTYESKLRPFVEEEQNLPSFVPAIAHPKSAWKRWLLKVFVWALAKIASFPWAANMLGDGGNDDKFPLPEYPSLDDEGSK
ncbi:FAD/NAD(P)-binding domain-containing protein [Viridothelium virens]|uniref:FAD/NAD(P)-binding domain-containing protein n=1 Tax=Viridothelium virens TaxID=1048519 RepID=A0A6A6HHH0_VIRVR|nr:FAD/NAD(P)-binding domain-containing protein [Viridothelium virens]